MFINGDARALGSVRGSLLTPVHGSDGWFWWWWKLASWTFWIRPPGSLRVVGSKSTKLKIPNILIILNQLESDRYILKTLSFWILAGHSYQIVEAILGRLENGQSVDKMVFNSNHILILGWHTPPIFVPINPVFRSFILHGLLAGGLASSKSPAPMW